MGEFKERAYRGQLRQGFWLPFGLLAIGIYFLVQEISFSYNDLEYSSGRIQELKVNKNIYIQLDNNKQFVITDPKHKKKVRSVLKDSLFIEIWTIPNKKRVSQLKIKDNLLIEFPSLLEGLIFPLVLIIISFIFIPLVIKERRKHATYFGDDKLFGKGKYEEEQ